MPRRWASTPSIRLRRPARGRSTKWSRPGKRTANQADGGHTRAGRAGRERGPAGPAGRAGNDRCKGHELPQEVARPLDRGHGRDRPDAAELGAGANPQSLDISLGAHQDSRLKQGRQRRPPTGSGSSSSRASFCAVACIDRRSLRSAVSRSPRLCANCDRIGSPAAGQEGGLTRSPTP